MFFPFSIIQEVDTKMPLYVGMSVCGGKDGFKGTEKELYQQNVVVT